MKAIPVRNYRSPVYPTRLQVLADPTILQRHVPPAWRSRAPMAGALAAFLAVNAQVQASDSKLPKSKEAAVVAPIFKHGEGRGATGCIVVAPPTFLSEEEALQVIVEELSKAGLAVTRRNVELPSVVMPNRMSQMRFTIWGIPVPYRRVQDAAKQAGIKGQWKPFVQEFPGKPLNVDIFDDQRRVAVEFLSRKDYRDVGGIWSFSSVQSYNFAETATNIAKQVTRQGKDFYFGVLYDPASKGNLSKTSKTESVEDRLQNRQQRRQQAHAESLELLREQVKDFMDWLKGQGVI